MRGAEEWSGIVDLDTLEWITDIILRHILSATKVQLNPHILHHALQLHKLGTSLGKKRSIQRHRLNGLLQEKLAVTRKDVLGLLGEVVEAELLFVVPLLFVEGDVFGDAVSGEGVGL